MDNIKNELKTSHARLSEKVFHTACIKIPVASICSGLGIAEMVFENLNPALEELLETSPAMQAR